MAKGMSADFLRFDIPPSGLLNFIEKVRTEKISGLAVSIPHKEAIIPLLDELTETARSIGAVNTVFWKEGSLWGENTDAPGFFRALEPVFAHHSSSLKCAVVGAGGAARAIVFALKNAGADVSLFNRSLHRAEALANTFGAVAMPLEDFAAREYDLVINSTSVGLKQDKSPVPADSWKGFSGTAFDAVFDPLKTRFLRDAEFAGAKIITGEKMLLFQGVLQFALWTGSQAPELEMEAALKNAIEKK